MDVAAGVYGLHMKPQPLAAVALLFLTASLAVAGMRADPPSEIDKITGLLTHIREMKDVEFIRNGKAYDGRAAAQHIQAKYDKVKSEIKTAREFIEKCASKSERSGEAYKIRFKDGTEKTAGEYLNAQLDVIEKPGN